MHIKRADNSGFFIHSGAMPAQGHLYEGQRSRSRRRRPQGPVDRPRRRLSPSTGAIVRSRPAAIPPPRLDALPAQREARRTDRSVEPLPHYRQRRLGETRGERARKSPAGRSAIPAKAISASESEGAPCNFPQPAVKELPSTNPPASEIAEEYQGFNRSIAASICGGLEDGDRRSGPLNRATGSSTAPARRAFLSTEKSHATSSWCSTGRARRAATWTSGSARLNHQAQRPKFPPASGTASSSPSRRSAQR